MDEFDNGAAEAVSEPISTSEPSQPQEQSSYPSIREALERNFAQDSGEAQPVKNNKDRASDGRFTAKNEGQKDIEKTQHPYSQSEKIEQNSNIAATTTFTEPPKRFSPEARVAWGQTPDPIKVEVNRAFSELEKGLSEYQAKFEPLKEFEELAKQYGTTIPAALKNYIGIENLIAANPVKGLTLICENGGLSIYDIAAQILGQQPDQRTSAQENVIRELRQELAEMKREVGGITTTFRTQQEQSISARIQDFSKDKPRFAELESDMAFFLQNGRAANLQQAYELAERLNPVQSPPAPIDTPAPQTRKGNLSITGASSSGSNPTNRKPPSSAREAVRSAARANGFSV